ncbi:MAG: glycosyltransferase family 1 protein [Candidatus Omnitrophota bacterium]|nr:MAG: glycosyltransferase family 1 protein [Candidatus Omnitrophota bacterium]
MKPEKEMRSGPLHICLVSREYPPETGWGGIGRYTYLLAHGLAAAGHQVHVIAQSLDDDKEYLDAEVRVHRIAHRQIFYHKGVFKEFGLRLEYGFCVKRKIEELIQRYRIDIVEGANFSGETFIFSLAKKIPLVIRLHTTFREVMEFLGWKNNLDRRLASWMEDATIARSDTVLCSTRLHAENIFGDITEKQKKIKIVPLGISLPGLPKKHFSDATHNGCYQVLFVGRLEKRKGIHVLCRAIPYVLDKVPTATFNIVGRDLYVTPHGVSFSGDEQNSAKRKLMQSIPEKYRNRVVFRGHVEAEALADYYMSCDVFVAPSLYESFGLIYIEAMSYAKPVIGCGVGGVPEVIADKETGFLVPPEDHYSLAETITRLLKDSRLRNTLGIHARKLVEEKFTAERMVENTVAVYRGALAR